MVVAYFRQEIDVLTIGSGDRADEVSRIAVERGLGDRVAGGCAAVEIDAFNHVGFGDEQGALVRVECER